MSRRAGCGNPARPDLWGAGETPPRSTRPCKLARKRDPLGDKDVVRQLLDYDDLGGNCPSGIITPQLGINP